jgi:two-component system OmpR family sensor kinase
VIITGLPLDGVYGATYRLAAVVSGVSLIALMLAALAGMLIVRRTLRPLRRVAATATG